MLRRTIFVKDRDVGVSLAAAALSSSLVLSVSPPTAPTVPLSPRALQANKEDSTLAPTAPRCSAASPTASSSLSPDLHRTRASAQQISSETPSNASLLALGHLRSQRRLYCANTGATPLNAALRGSPREGASSVETSRTSSSDSPFDYKRHLAVLRRRQQVCPHLFLIAGTYNGPPATGNPSPPQHVHQQCEWCGLSRVLATAAAAATAVPEFHNEPSPKVSSTFSSSSSSPHSPPSSRRSRMYMHNKAFERLQPTTADAEEPWVDAAYTIHCALTALDLHVKGGGGGGGGKAHSVGMGSSGLPFPLPTAMMMSSPSRQQATSSQPSQQEKNTQQTPRQASSEAPPPSSSSSSSSSLATRFLASLTAQVSGRAMYRHADERRAAAEAREGAARLDAMTPTTSEAVREDAPPESTKAEKSSSIVQQTASANPLLAKKSNPNAYPLAAPQKPIVTIEGLYDHVPHFRNISRAFPPIPFQHHVTTLGLAAKYFASVSKKECLSRYLTKEVERELGLFAASPHHRGTGASNGYELFQHPSCAAGSVAPQPSSGTVPLRFSESQPTTATTTDSVIDANAPSSDDHPLPSAYSLGFVQSALRAVKFCAVAYGTAYERHFFDSVMAVGRVRSFYEIYQSDHASHLAAARRMAASDVRDMPIGTVWSTRGQCFYTAASSEGAPPIPTVEVIEGNWTNVPWGITYVIAVDHRNKEITLAFRGTFADAGIVVDIHNGPLSLFSKDEEARLGIGMGHETFNNSKATSAAVAGAESSVSPSSVNGTKANTDEHYTAPFGFVINMRPGSAQTRPIDRALLRLALVDYPSYKVVVTGHSLGAAYASNFVAARLLFGTLARERGLFDDPTTASTPLTTSSDATGGQGKFSEANAKLSRQMAAVRRSVLDTEAATTAAGRDQSQSAYNSALDAMLEEATMITEGVLSSLSSAASEEDVLDFSDPFTVAGLYVNGFIRREDNKYSAATDAFTTTTEAAGKSGNPHHFGSFVSTVEDRIVVNSLAPPASVNMAWRRALATRFPRLDFRSFVHDTDVVTRLQITSLRVMQETINNNSIIPNVFQRKFSSLVTRPAAAAAAAAGVGLPTFNFISPNLINEEEASPTNIGEADSDGRAGSGEASGFDEDAPVFESIHKHLATELSAIDHRLHEGQQRATTGDASNGTSGASAAAEPTVDTAKHPSANEAHASVSNDSSRKHFSAALTARCPTEQLQNQNDLATCFTHHKSDGAEEGATPIPREDTANNYWVPLGQIYLLGRKGQEYMGYPRQMGAEGGAAIDSAITDLFRPRLVELSDKGEVEEVANNSSRKTNLNPSDRFADNLIQAEEESGFNVKFSTIIAPFAATFGTSARDGAASEAVGAGSGSQQQQHQRRSIAPPTLYDVPDSSFDIATAFNTVRREATISAISDPLAPALAIPNIDVRTAHNHFLFRYARAILDLAASPHGTHDE